MRSGHSKGKEEEKVTLVNEGWVRVEGAQIGGHMGIEKQREKGSAESSISHANQGPCLASNYTKSEKVGSHYNACGDGRHA